MSSINGNTANNVEKARAAANSPAPALPAVSRIFMTVWTSGIAMTLAIVSSSVFCQPVAVWATGLGAGVGSCTSGFSTVTASFGRSRRGPLRRWLVGTFPRL